MKKLLGITLLTLLCAGSLAFAQDHVEGAGGQRGKSAQHHGECARGELGHGRGEGHGRRGSEHAHRGELRVRGEHATRGERG